MLHYFKKGVCVLHSPGKASARSRSTAYQDWQRRRWEHLQRWCQHRPGWGAFCTIIASLLILWGPVCILQSAIVPASALSAGLLVGGLLLAMGLIELFAPSQAPVAGAAGIVLSLVSLITALGGFGIGMLVGLIGSSYVLTWKPESKTRRSPFFWSVLGCSLALALGLITLVTRGEIAVAAPIAGPFTTFTGRLECHNVHSVPALSQVDHRTYVIRTYAEYCTASHVVVTQHVLGATIHITEATHSPAILRGVTSEIVSSYTAVSQSSDETATNLEQTSAVNIQINVTSMSLFQNVESTTVSDVSLSIS